MWFKVDDGLAFHAKTVAAGNAAMGLWVRAGAWSAQQLTDGHVPAHMVAALGATRKHAAALVAAGLWVQADDGYRFHEWEQRQPSADEVRADRAAKHDAKAAAGRLGGIASGVARRKHKPSNAEANAEQNEPPTRPDPTRPAVGVKMGEEVEVELPPDPLTSELPPTDEELAEVRAVLRSVPWLTDEDVA